MKQAFNFIYYTIYTSLHESYARNNRARKTENVVKIFPSNFDEKCQALFTNRFEVSFFSKRVHIFEK